MDLIRGEDYLKVCEEMDEKRKQKKELIKYLFGIPIASWVILTPLILWQYTDVNFIMGIKIFSIGFLFLLFIYWLISKIIK